MHTKARKTKQLRLSPGPRPRGGQAVSEPLRRATAAGSLYAGGDVAFPSLTLPRRERAGIEVELLKAVGPVQGLAAQVAFLRHLYELIQDNPDFMDLMPDWPEATPVTEVIAWVITRFRQVYQDEHLFVAAFNGEGAFGPALHRIVAVPETDYCSIVYCDFLQLVNRRFPRLMDALLGALHALSNRDLETWTDCYGFCVVRDSLGEEECEEDERLNRATVREYEHGAAKRWHDKIHDTPCFAPPELAQYASELLAASKHPMARRIANWLLHAADLLNRRWNISELVPGSEYQQTDPEGGEPEDQHPVEFCNYVRFLWSRHDPVSQYETEHMDCTWGNEGSVPALVHMPLAAKLEKPPIWPALLVSLMTDLQGISEDMWAEEYERRAAKVEADQARAAANEEARLLINILKDDHGKDPAQLPLHAEGGFAHLPGS